MNDLFRLSAESRSYNYSNLHVYQVTVSQQLTLQLSDEIYADFQQKADAAGLPMTEWIITVLNQQNRSLQADSPLTAQQEEARQRFRNHAGSIRLGHPTGSDNESIDADLARAYADEYQRQD